MSGLLWDKLKEVTNSAEALQSYIKIAEDLKIPQSRSRAARDVGLSARSMKTAVCRIHVSCSCTAPVTGQHRQRVFVFVKRVSWTSKQRLMETVVHQTGGHTLSALKCKGATVLCDRRKNVSLLLRSASCCLLEVAETESDTAACTDRLLQGLPS